MFKNECGHIIYTICTLIYVWLIASHVMETILEVQCAHRFNIN